MDKSDETWTGKGFSWQSWDDSNTYTGNHSYSEPAYGEPEIIYRNGQKLSAGEQRPNPFWINYCNKTLPVYNEFITNYNKSIMRFRMCGAYSRYYDKPRKFRKRRLF